MVLSVKIGLLVLSYILCISEVVQDRTQISNVICLKKCMTFHCEQSVLIVLSMWQVFKIPSMGSDPIQEMNLGVHQTVENSKNNDY